MDLRVLRENAAFAFGPYRFLPHRQLLLRDGRPVRLGGRAKGVLHALLRHAGEVVAGETLIALVWPDRHVENSNLRVHVRTLRKALGEVRTRPRYLATVAGRGYSFVGRVTVEKDAATGRVGASRSRTHALPPRRPLVGREEEVARLARALDGGGLVTLVGTGGVGKTAVAVEAAHDRETDFADGACFVDLSATTDYSLVPHLVATALGVRGSHADITSATCDHLESRRVLVVLDNCEHVLPAVATLVTRILRAGVSACLLATSREALGISGENVRRINPLPYPRRSAVPSLDDARAFPSVELFATRVAEQTNFDIGESDAPTIARLCEALDGLPLALELAAAKMGEFTPEQLLSSIDNRFEILRSQDPHVRQGTLWKVLDWSYLLLPEREARLLGLLSVFAGAFEQVDATVMSGAAGCDAYQATVALGCLVAKSLVAVEGEGDAVRYRLLDSIRCYAAEKLREDPTLEREANIGHANLVLSIFERSEQEWNWAEIGSWRARYQRRVGDLRKALDWCFDGGGQPTTGVSLAAAAVRLWNEQSSIFEQTYQVERALSHRRSIPGGVEKLARLAIAKAWSRTLAREIGPETEDAWRAAIDCGERSGDQSLRLSALSAHAVYLVYTGRSDRAVGRLVRCVALAERHDDLASLIDSERRKALAELHLGRLEQARLKLERLSRGLGRMPASRIARYREERYVSIHSTLAFLAWLTGRPERATRIIDEMVEKTGDGRQLLGQSNILALVSLPVALWRGDLHALDAATATLRGNLQAENIAIWVPVVRFYAAVAEHARGQADAIDRMELAVDELLRDGFLLRTPMYQGVLAEASLESRDIDRAARVVDRALAQRHVCKEPWYLPELMRIKARVAAAAGDRKQARVLLLRARTGAEKMGARFFQLRIANDLARLPTSAKHRSESIASLRKLHESFREGHGIPDLLRAAYLCGPNPLADHHRSSLGTRVHG